MTIVRPAIYNGQELKDYGIDNKTGDIYSFKDKIPKKLKWTHRHRKNIKMSYPCVSLYDTDVFTWTANGKLTINLHIIVQETLVPIPIPEGTTPNEWRTTPNSVKRWCRKAYIVNHIDHNKVNYKPKNLEWTTTKGNAEKYKEFRAV